jgi:hypothetical protein
MKKSIKNLEAKVVKNLNSLKGGNTGRRAHAASNVGSVGFEDITGA